MTGEFVPLVTWTRLHQDIVRTILDGLQTVLNRQNDAYPFLNTKFDSATGENFADDDPLRGPGAVYTWIQGRALEALSGHGRWLKDFPAIEPSLRRQLIARIRGLLPLLMGSMESARARNGGFLPFLMSPTGDPLRVDAMGRVVPGDAPEGYSFSDLFYAKGLVATADFLGDSGMLETAVHLMDGVVSSLREGTFSSGQITLDPKNPVKDVAGRFSHAGWMIGTGAATLFSRCTGEARFVRVGREFIVRILNRHVQIGAGRFRPGDFWEFVDGAGVPWDGDGRIWSDPGHATEFSGLAFAHLLEFPGEWAEQTADILRTVLVQNFENGFTGHGIVKAFDLVSRRPINSDQPWWSLPETMRAAALAARGAEGELQGKLQDIFLRCWNAFAGHYVRPHCGLAVQCLDEAGRVTTSIPATPDIDPGYHTGLSLIACLECLDDSEMGDGMKKTY